MRRACWRLLWRESRGGVGVGSHTASARFLFSGWRAEWDTPTDRDHRAILLALRRGDTEAAALLLGRHVQWIGQKPARMQVTRSSR